MANERDRAARMHAEFEQLLAQLEEQDEQIQALCAAAGVRLEDLPEPEHADRVLEAFEEAVEDRRRELLQTRERRTLTGLVLRA